MTSQKATETHTAPKRAYSVDEFCQAHGIGRNRAYQEIEAGRLRVAKVGRRTLIPVDEAEAWLRSLMDPAGGVEA
jgi:excisionase family DNA binding protein